MHMEWTGLSRPVQTFSKKKRRFSTVKRVVFREFKKEDAGKGAAKPPPPVRVVLDSKKRRGKTVTLVENIPHNPQVIEELCRTLKTLCGAGGTVEGKTILVQGDHRERVVAKLNELGYKVK
jgi:translation initiation factor 1